MAPAIRTNNLTKRFGSLTAVDGLDLTIEEGEIFGFLGPNGAGKSTTINLLLDFIRPSDGSAEVLGYDTRSESIPIRDRTGVLPEGFSVYERLTALEHVEYAIETKDAADDPRDLLDRVHLDREAHERKAGEFSTGMTQRLALAMALVDDPDLLVLDEPSSGLDPTGIQEMQEIVRSEAERGTTVFFSSHILDHVEEVCDRIGVMNEGELVAIGTLDELHAQIGGDAHLELSVDDVSDRTVETLTDIDGISGATARNGHLDVSCSRSAAKAKAINHVEAAGTTVLDIQVEDQDIDDLFAELTGNGAKEEAETIAEEVPA